MESARLKQILFIRPFRKSAEPVNQEEMRCLGDFPCKEQRKTDPFPGTHPDGAQHPLLYDSLYCAKSSEATAIRELLVKAGNASRRAMNDNLAQCVGRYRIKSILGRGSFGLLFLGSDERLNREVAIKVPHQDPVLSRERAEACFHEARIAGSLDHPHIVPVLDVGRSDEFPCFIVFKYINGLDLRKKLKARGLNVFEAAELIATLAETLDYAHTKQVVHRDLKPGNILIGADGTPYLIDFGLAVRQEESAGDLLCAGTIPYMSPEQAQGERCQADPRSDIYSLGAVFYELLTGRRLFPRSTTRDYVDQIARREPLPPRQVEAFIPRELEQICLKAIAKRVADRYPTALEMAQELRQFLADHSEPRAADVDRLTRSQSGLRAVPTKIVSRTPSGSARFTNGDSEDMEASRLLSTLCKVSATDKHFRWRRIEASLPLENGSTQERGPASRPSQKSASDTNSGSLDGLMQALRSDRREVWCLAADCLASLGSKAVPSLAAALSNPWAETRRRSAWVLCRIGPAAAPALPELIRALSDPSPEVRWRSADVIDALGGKTLLSASELLEVYDQPDPELHWRITSLLEAR